MTEATTLDARRVLVVDAQASGATPSHGDLLELGWQVLGPHDDAGPIRSHWLVPETDRRVPRAVRELTGWNEDVLASALAPAAAWARLCADAGDVRPVPTLVHWARFERPFLERLHATSGGGTPFPLDVVCVHALAERLFPKLPRKSLRALAGHLGGSPELARRSAGHVASTAFVWRAMRVPLAEAGVRTWDELRAWLEAKAPTRARAVRREFPLAVEKRRALPLGPGVYRFVRLSGDVLYVGKAASLRRRVGGHFTAAGRRTHERALEMLTQVHDVVVTETESALEAALLEADEIKRLDPPYNVHLRAEGRRAWFATRAFEDARDTPDEVHVVGPLSSRWAATSLGALRRLVAGEAPTAVLAASALGVPRAFAPDLAVFDEAWRAFSNRFPTGARDPVLAAGRALLPRDEAETPEDAPEGWDVPRVVRHLERMLAGGALAVLRARALCLLCDSAIVFREPGASLERRLVVEGAEVRREGPTPRPRPLRERRASFDAARYDRMRVLATELLRVVAEGGQARVEIGAHRFVLPRSHR